MFGTGYQLKHKKSFSQKPGSYSYLVVDISHWNDDVEMVDF